jgi:tRNA A-37 threonylcarbamoyl transferase component Bud32
MTNAREPGPGDRDRRVPIVRTEFRRHLAIDPRYDSPALHALLADPDRPFREGGATVLKSDRTTSVARVDTPAHAFVVKRYNLRDPVHALRQAVRRSRAARCWRSARRLQALGLSTAAPVAYCEHRLGPLRRRAWYVCEHVPGPQALEYFAGNDLSPEQEQVGERIAGLLHALFQARISHGDLKATNIIIHEGRPVLVDLDAMRHHCTRWAHRRAARADRERFLRNWQSLPAVHQHFRRLMSGD